MSKLQIAQHQQQTGDANKILSAVGHPGMREKLGNAIDSYVDVKLTAAQLDALNATPVTLIAAPGSGKVTVVTKVFGFLDYGTATYAGSSQVLKINYTDGSGATVATFLEAFGEATADKYEAPAIADCYPVANAAIVAATNADWTTGDSVIYLRIHYHVVDLADLATAAAGT
jgi:hypothetical protein